MLRGVLSDVFKFLEGLGKQFLKFGSILNQFINQNITQAKCFEILQG